MRTEAIKKLLCTHFIDDIACIFLEDFISTVSSTKKIKVPPLRYDMQKKTK